VNGNEAYAGLAVVVIVAVGLLLLGRELVAWYRSDS